MERTVAERLHGSWRVNGTSFPVAALLAWALLAAPADHAWAVQLPPEIQADLYEEQLEQRLEERDFEGAKETMDQILTLGQDHGLEIPDVFYFQYAEVLQQIGLYEAAVEELTRYLSLAGQEGEHYQTALTMLIEARESLDDFLAHAPPTAAELRRAGHVFRDCPSCPEMVVIRAGRFRMGCVSGRDCEDDEQPVGDVSVGSFALSKFEVTFEEYDRFTEATGRARVDDVNMGRGTRPVINVSWTDAQAYVAWLSAETGETHRLPSEAEWEYAARAGTSTAYSWGNEPGNNRANCNGCGSQWDGEQTAPVGSFGANAWGLYDMHGNVWEWVGDCWHESYRRAPSDGTAWTSGGDCSLRVLRGGSWNLNPRDLRSAIRDRLTTGIRLNIIGFRVARTVTP